MHYWCESTSFSRCIGRLSIRNAFHYIVGRNANPESFEESVALFCLWLHPGNLDWVREKFSVGNIDAG